MQTEFQRLGAQMKRLRGGLADLRRLIDDHPPHGDQVLLLDAFGDAVDEMRGWLEEARRASAPAQAAPKAKGDQGFDQNLARQALCVSQDQFNRVSHRFAFDLVSYDRVAELLRLGRERGGEWQTWAKGIKAELERCQQHLYHTSQALFRCWLEIADRVGLTSVSVQSTNIGQHITVPTTEELTVDGVT